LYTSTTGLDEMDITQVPICSNARQQIELWATGQTVCETKLKISGRERESVGEGGAVCTTVFVRNTYTGARPIIRSKKRK
jgi:hypothetical protein